MSRCVMPSVKERPTSQLASGHCSAGNGPDLIAEGTRLRALLADTAEAIAAGAESVADTFEDSVACGNREWRAEIAATEREISGILRRNAVRLREQANPPKQLEQLPRLAK